MANTKPRKRPCSICRKWFLPDVRQKGRQTTCSLKCREKKHRRQCEAWNRKNKAYFKAIYLNQKLAQTNKPPPDHPTESKKKYSPPSCRVNLHLPYDVIENQIGAGPCVVVQYLIEQIVCRSHRNPFFGRNTKEIEIFFQDTLQAQPTDIIQNTHELIEK